MSGIINQVGARSGVISGGGSASAGTVTLSGTTGLDYEEGTWIPACTSQGSSFAFDAKYVKVGKLVHFSANIYSIGSTGGSSSFLISGLPFTSRTLHHSGISIGYKYFVNSPTNYPLLTLRVGSSVTGMNVQWAGDDATVVSATCTDFDNANAQLIFGGCYICA